MQLPKIFYLKLSPNIRDYVRKMIMTRRMEWQTCQKCNLPFYGMYCPRCQSPQFIFQRPMMLGQINKIG